MIHQLVRFRHVPTQCVAQVWQGIFIEANQQRFGVGRTQNFIEEYVKRGIRYRVESEWRFTHLRDAFSPGRCVLCAVVSVKAEAHLQFVDWLSSQAVNEDLVESPKSPMVTFQSTDTVIDRKSNSSSLGKRGDSGHRRKVSVRAIRF